MSNEEFKNQTISDLFKSKTIHLRIEMILYEKAGLARNVRGMVVEDLTQQVFLDLCRKDADWFYDTFHDDPNYLMAYVTNMAKNMGVRTNKLKPKPSSVREFRFASSFNSSHNNVLEPTEFNYDSEQSSDGISAKVLASEEPDVNDKHQLFQFLKENLSTEEIEILDILTNHKQKPGRKKQGLQQQIDDVKSKVKTLLQAHSSNYYKARAITIGEQLLEHRLSGTNPKPLSEDEKGRLSKFKPYKAYEEYPVSKWNKRKDNKNVDDEEAD
ncbi:hypothetical protein [Pedobacter sp. MR2016-24]|uniref:hypothetical protein n=1 Tax=Pedobacter sp. MR2016-24 TaxID=2994466 RepID=UPI002245D8F6|nr:hypothetical protein [Pedobacter sp. MR2016-24]MCX2486593.1 hypothetical protein [Pedobacter sp. MR2016-24]